MLTIGINENHSPEDIKDIGEAIRKVAEYLRPGGED